MVLRALMSKCKQLTGANWERARLRTKEVAEARTMYADSEESSKFAGRVNELGEWLSR